MPGYPIGKNPTGTSPSILRYSDILLSIRNCATPFISRSGDLWVAEIGWETTRGLLERNSRQKLVITLFQRDPYKESTSDEVWLIMRSSISNLYSVIYEFVS